MKVCISILEAGGFGDGSSNNSDPRAFVNIIIFDKNYKLLDWTYQQMPPGAASAPTLMSATYTIKEEGYAYMYVSNENPTLVDVYFDDVTMTYTPGNVIQYNEFYNHGLPNANSWTRQNNAGNNFLGNGGTELNQLSNLYDLDYRNYDPVLGRMNGVDPMASKYGSLTPYNFAFNDPVTFNDPSGADPLYNETTRAAFGETMQGGYFKPRIMDNGVFGRPYSSGSVILNNIGFTNVNTWRLLSSAWSSVGVGQTGFWQVSTGSVVSGGVIDEAKRTIVSWVGAAPSDYNTAASIVASEIISTIIKTGGTKYTMMQASGMDQIMSLISKQLGITSNDIFNNATVLENVDIYDSPIEDIVDATKFTVSFGGVIQAGTETLNALWEGRKAVASRGLTYLGRLTGAVGAYDHMQHLGGAFEDGGFSNPQTYYYAGALVVDGIFMFGKVTNPIYLGGYAVFSLIDTGLGVYWEQQEKQKSEKKGGN